MQRTTAMDKRIGSNIRRLRKDHNLTQTQLGEMINSTFQMIQKYEAGSSRCSAAIIGHMAEALAVSPAEFYAEVTDA